MVIESFDHRLPNPEAKDRLMAVALRHHTVTVSAPVPQPRPDTAEGIHAQAGAAVRRVLLYPLTPGKAFEQFGVECKRPHQIIDNPDAAYLYEQGGEVLYAGRKFKIEAPPMVFEGIGGADNMSVLLQEVIG